MNEKTTHTDAEEMTSQQEAPAPVPAADQEKKFTQADLDRIVKDRLKRSDEAKEKAHSEEIAAIQKSVTERENRLACREYLLDKGYPADLLEIIDTSSPEEFKKKADKAYNLTSGGFSHPAAPLADTESLSSYGRDGTQISVAFARERKHKPKKWPEYQYEEI